MSKSYRKPYWTQGYGGAYRKFIKRYANKVFRKYRKEISSGCYYKKVGVSSWDICDWKFYDYKSKKPWKCKSK